jgi:hypothetical protein
MLAHADSADLELITQLEGGHLAVPAEELENALASGPLLFALSSH